MTEIKLIEGTEYICSLTNNVEEGDLIVITTLEIPISAGIKHFGINKIVFYNAKNNILKYEYSSGYKSSDFGFSNITTITNLNEHYNLPEYTIPVFKSNILFSKIIGTVKKEKITNINLNK